MSKYFTFQNSSDKVAIPEDWMKLSNFIQDIPMEAVEMEEIPLIGYDKPEVELLIELVDFIKANDSATYNAALHSSANINTENFNNLNFEKFLKVEERTRIQALNLSDYLGLVIARKFLIGAMADKIIRLKDDVISINKLLGGQMLTPQDCIDNGIPADDKLWDAFPHVKEVIFG
uniref:Skp1_POZ domain-containing protein n=1 Tax=Panagrellus redivivus TaxID=6233 RepID=A0A7E4V1N6_PANRE